MSAVRWMGVLMSVWTERPFSARTSRATSPERLAAGRAGALSPDSANVRESFAMNHRVSPPSTFSRVAPRKRTRSRKPCRPAPRWIGSAMVCGGVPSDTGRPKDVLNPRPGRLRQSARRGTYSWCARSRFASTGLCRPGGT